MPPAMRRFLILTPAIGALLFASAFFFLQPDWNRSSLPTIETDVLVYGSSLGGTSAAIIAAEHGARVVFASDAAVIGGQAVESGISAFDDLNQPWEQWGLYADLQEYLRNQYGSTNGKNVGLGTAVTGRVASIPNDIQDFFIHRIKKNQRITLLARHSISSLKKSRGQWHTAILSNLQDHSQVRVNFEYLVDGTETGQLFEKTQTPFYIGFDKRERTGEKFALPDLIRQSFIKGTYLQDTKIDGFGNRVQAVNSPFILVDRGYPGTFFPISPVSTDCPGSASVASFITDVPIVQLSANTCTAHIPIQPEFSDTYDAYLIHHGNGEVQVRIQSPAFPGLPLHLSIELSSAGTSTFLGTFFLPTELSTITISSTTHAPQLEGVVLVKRNIHVYPTIIDQPFTQPVIINQPDISAVEADIYFVGNNLSGQVPLRVRGEETYPLPLGPTTLRLSQISLRKPLHLSLPDTLREKISSIIVIPTSLDLAPLRFSSDSPDREIPVSEIGADSLLRESVTPIREWDFSAPESGNTVFSIGTNIDKWRLIELWEDSPPKKIHSQSFLTHNVTRNPRPIFSASLQKGAKYRLRIGLPRNESWDTFTWSVDPMTTSAALFTNEVKVGPARPRLFEGIYDLWSRNAQQSPSTFSIHHPSHPNVQMVIPAANAQYEYLGKALLDRMSTLQTDSPDAQILAIPNQFVDTYEWTGTLSHGSPSLLFSTLPPGQYRLVLTGGPSSADTLHLSQEQNQDQQLLSLPQSDFAMEPRLVPEMLIITGSPLTLKFPPNFASSRITLRFYEEIPDLSSSWSFNMALHPLTGSASTSVVPLFLFRNIVSSAWILKGKPEGYIPKHIARNTLGMTIVNNPSNDYAIVPAEDIDDTSVVQNSRYLSAAYAYWMRYDSSLTPQNLNCDPGNFTCTPKRTQPVFGLFADPLSLFAPKPYIREGRRLSAKRMITFEDISLQMNACENGKCPASCKPLQRVPYCATEHQDPLLFPDALAAAGYIIDLHAFYSPQEYFSKIKRFRTAYEKQQLPDNAYTLVTQQWLYPYSKPAEIPLNSLLPITGTNVFPASHTIGMTQIANGLFRTHVNELAIGQSIGYVLSYCIANRIPPAVIIGAELASLQHTLVEEDVILFPIADMFDDDLLRKSVQHLIIERLLLPQATLHSDPQVPLFGAVRYSISPKIKNGLSDAAQQLLSKQLQSTSMTSYRELILSLVGTDSSHVLSDDALRSYAIEKGIMDAEHRSLPTQEALNAPPSNGDLYRATYVLMRNQWIGQKNFP